MATKSTFSMQINVQKNHHTVFLISSLWFETEPMTATSYLHVYISRERIRLKSKWFWLLAKSSNFSWSVESAAERVFRGRSFFLNTGGESVQRKGKLLVAVWEWTVGGSQWSFMLLVSPRRNARRRGLKCHTVINAQVEDTGLWRWMSRRVEGEEAAAVLHRCVGWRGRSPNYPSSCSHCSQKVLWSGTL